MSTCTRTMAILSRSYATGCGLRLAHLVHFLGCLHSRVMTDDQKPEPPDVDGYYARYLKTCRRLGVEPVSLERAHELMDEWSDAIKHAPPTQH